MPISKAISVSELTAQIRQLLERGFSRVQVCGEVSRLVKHRSGHLYFTIKDSNAALSAVIWHSNHVRMQRTPEEGNQYIFSGHISLYAPQGRYQLTVTAMTAAGSGALAAEFERKKQIFMQRGWFEPTRKQAIPPLPTHIGIITGEQTAAFQDVRKVLATRPAWLRLTLSPTIVQGAQAATDIPAAIHRLCRLSTPPDVILLVRGGGSPEDLWCFNEESVVQAIVECPIPVIAGIGHEIDTTLADLAADVRAATPSNAAEMACVDVHTLRERLPRISLLYQYIQQGLQRATHALKVQDTRLLHHWRIMQDQHHLHIERHLHRLDTGLRHQTHQKRQRLHDIHQKLSSFEPHIHLRRQQHTLAQWNQRLHAARLQQITRDARVCQHLNQRLHALWPARIASARHLLGQHTASLTAMNPVHVLSRGYSLAQTADGKMITSITQIATGDRMNIRFADGKAHTHIESVTKDKGKIR